MNNIKKYNAGELPVIERFKVKVARNGGKVGEEKRVTGWYIIVKTANDGEWHSLNEVLDAHDMKTKTLVFSKAANGEGYDRATAFAKKCMETWGKEKAVKGAKKATTAEGVDLAKMSADEQNKLLAALLAAQKAA